MSRLIGFSIVVMLCSVSVSFSQEQADNRYISKGQWMAGGSLSLSTSHNFDNFSFTVAPKAGYFLGKKVVVGLNPRYSLGNVYYNGQLALSSRIVDASIFVRDYFSNNRIAPFVELMGGGRWIKHENIYYGDATFKYFPIISFGVGLNYFISQDVAIEGILRYSDNNDYDDGFLDVDIGLQFFTSRSNNSTSDQDGNYFSKGQWLIGGRGDVSLGAVENVDAYSFSLSPMAGYLVGNKMAIGLSTGFGYTKGASYGFSAAPFFRYYIAQQKLAPYAEVAYGGSWSRIAYPDADDQTISNTLYRLSAGLNYFISKNVAIDSNLRYSGSKDSNAGLLNFSAGLQFFIR